MTTSRAIHVSANGIVSFFFMAEQHSMVCVCVSVCTASSLSVHGHVVSQWFWNQKSSICNYNMNISVKTNIASPVCGVSRDWAISIPLSFFFFPARDSWKKPWKGSRESRGSHYHVTSHDSLKPLPTATEITEHQRVMRGNWGLREKAVWSKVHKTTNQLPGCPLHFGFCVWTGEELQIL